MENAFVQCMGKMSCAMAWFGPWNGKNSAPSAVDRSGLRAGKGKMSSKFATGRAVFDKGSVAFAAFDHLVVYARAAERFKTLGRQPPAMHSRPRRATGINATMPQKKRLQMLSRFSQPVICDLARTHQIANSFTRFIWHPYRRQLTSPMEPGQTYSVATVGLDPVARTPGNERRGHHRATMTKPNDLPVKLVTGRTRLVAEVGLAAAFRELCYHRRYRCRLCRDVAKKSDFTHPVRHRQPRPKSSILMYRVRRKVRYPYPWSALA